VRGLAALVTDALLYPFQPEQNKQASKMAREVVLIDVALGDTKMLNYE
jgi:hypothetical protein